MHMRRHSVWRSRKDCIPPLLGICHMRGDDRIVPEWVVLDRLLARVPYSTGYFDTMPQLCFLLVLKVVEEDHYASCNDERLCSRLS
jgi:hypothetical protein